MKIIGITGRVGSGKSEVLAQLYKKYSCFVIKADDTAHALYESDSECYNSVISIIGASCLDDNGRIDKAKMAAVIFGDKDKLRAVNEVVHPAVKRMISNEVEELKQKNDSDFIFVESALLLDAGLDDICDETWNIYVRDEVRRRRLKASRGYSDERIDEILSSQLSDEELKSRCTWTIDNSDEIELTMEQIGLIL